MKLYTELKNFDCKCVNNLCKRKDNKKTKFKFPAEFKVIELYALHDEKAGRRKSKIKTSSDKFRKNHLKISNFFEVVQPQFRGQRVVNS